VEVVVERRQLMESDAVAVVRQQVAEVQAAIVSSDASAWQLTCQQLHRVKQKSSQQFYHQRH